MFSACHSRPFIRRSALLDRHSCPFISTLKDQNSIMIGKSIFKRRASTRPPESTYVSIQTPYADAWPCVKGFRYLVQDKPAGTIGTDGFMDWNTKDDFFRFTRGRFVRNEAQEMSQRCVRFNMNELV